MAEKIGYKSTPEKTKPTSIFLTHDKMADISFMFKEKAFTVGICAGQRINKPRPRNVVELLTALNKANRGMVIGHWDISDNQDFILCSYSFPLFTQISDRDVMRIIELLSDDVRSFFIAVESVPVMRSVLGM